MLRLSLPVLCEALGASMPGANHTGEVRAVRGVVIDSRLAAPGQLFVALRGKNFDGHDFVGEAARRGAAAALVERMPEVGTGSAPVPCILVSDARRALGELARFWHSRFAAPTVAVTGSNGKTTVKNMLAGCLDAHVREAGGAPGRVLATEGNFNNEVGVPLTLLRQAEEDRFVVLEMGANHPGEIAHLTSLGTPSIGIVTGCSPAHLEGFGNVEGVAAAKGELFAGLPEMGTAVINADDPFARHWWDLAAHCQRMGFGFDPGADVSGRYTVESTGSRIFLDTPAGRLSSFLPLPGRHNVLDAMAATAACLSAGVALETIASALESVPGAPGRLQITELRNGLRVIDDTYNANPGSLGAALEVLTGQPGQHWLVLGDMAELGLEARALHRKAGEAARGSGVERLFTLGSLGVSACCAFGAGASHFRGADRLLTTLVGLLPAEVTILVKGSRSMRMERIVQALKKRG